MSIFFDLFTIRTEKNNWIYFLSYGNIGLFEYKKIDGGYEMTILHSIGNYLIFAFMAIVGGGSSIAVILGIIGTIIYKFYRKIKYGKSLYD